MAGFRVLHQSQELQGVTYVNEMVGEKWFPTWTLGCAIKGRKMGCWEGKKQHVPTPSKKTDQVVSREENISGGKKDVLVLYNK